MSHSNKTNTYTEFYYHFFRNILIVSLPLLFISALILCIPRSSANGVDTLTLTLSSSCTMSSVVDIEHNGSLTSGTYIQGIGQTTVKTLCNDGNGYSVYANGYSNNEEGNNKLINSEYPEYSINTGLATSGLTSAWAMKLNNIPDDPSPTPPVIEQDYNDTYGLVPYYWTKVAGRQSGTTDMDEGSSFTTTYAVYASSNQHAGSYVGQVKYLLTHPSTMPVYPIMQDIANWKNIRIPNIGDSIQAIDSRDGKKYWVTKLADGNIWMTQNLDFNIKSNTILDSTTTDLNVIYNSSTGQYTEYNDGYTENNDIIYWAPASTATTINFTDATVTSWDSSNTTPASANKADSTETGHASLGNYYNWTAAIASNNSSSLTQETISNITKNPKNSICPKGWRLPTISDQSETISGSTNEFARLNYLYNDGKTSGLANLLSSPLYLIGAGAIASNSHSWGGLGAGYYWTSTNYSSNNTWYFHFNTYGTILPKYNGRPKADGFSMRCIAK